MRVSFAWRGVLAAAVVSTAGLGGVMAATASAFPGPPSAPLFVNNSPTVPGRGDYWRGGEWYRHADGSCATAAFTTIGAAVSVAAPGSTIVVCPGRYSEGVQINKRLVLSGLPGAVIDASSSSFGNGVQILGGGSGSTVEGFKIENADFEGILVGTDPANADGSAVSSGAPVSHVTIADNTLVDNDTSFNGAGGEGVGQCFTATAPGSAPGDCGQALHLVSVTNSLVEGNYITNNAGGILLTDEFGPTSGNVVRDNRSVDGTNDCGITLAGHATGGNPYGASDAVSPLTGLPTGAAGVFDNLIEDNVSNNNGLLGQGAGILLGGGAPFAGVYSNVIRGNIAIGNGLAGVTIHQHFVGDLNNNVIEDNILSDDNIDGDGDFYPLYPTVDTQTTGIFVASGAPPVDTSIWPGAVSGTTGEITGTVIRGNRIFGVYYGIWTLNVDPTSTTTAPNFYGPGVTTPISTNTSTADILNP
jgi:nitrous oxidase accessory protein NosD